MKMTQNERITLPIWKKVILLAVYLLFSLLQILIIYNAFNFPSSHPEHAAVFKNLYGLIELTGIAIILSMLHQTMSTNYKLVWSILILCFPLPFVLLYSLNAYSKKKTIRLNKKIRSEIDDLKIKDAISHLDETDKTGANIVRAMRYDLFFPLYDNSRFIYFSDISNKFEDMLNEISKAEKYILIETFIIFQGKLMDRLIDALERKGKEGVLIRILYDDVGSKGGVPAAMLKRIAAIPNCRIDNYQPLGLEINLMVNYRDHRKITIIDGRVAYCGGDNLADEYINEKKRFGYWRDNCGKFEGEAVQSFLLMFCAMWYLSCKERLEVSVPKFSDNKKSDTFVVPFSDGPVNSADPAYDLFSSMISSASEYICISTPYLIIDDEMIHRIAQKAKSGVKVKILMPGIPDKKSVFYMSRYNYKEILKAGGEIYEYTPGFNHAKNIIVDDKYAFIGTANMDYRSLYLHYECGALIINSPEINKMKKDFDDALSESKKVEMKDWEKRPLIQKVTAFVLNLFSPMF